MWLNRIVLFVALLISGVAAFYSVTGLASIFTGATIAVLIMGTALEAGKVAAAAWLHKYWNEAHTFLKTYLIAAVVMLMAITSMGTFGFLSKAHLENTAGTSVAIEQVRSYEDQLQTADAELDRLDKSVERMDAIVANANPERANAIRRAQRVERADIAAQREIVRKDKAIAAEAKAKLRSTVVGAEAELGPIKYVAELIYGDNADASSFDKAIRWMIILLVVVFDPLAIALLVAAQSGMHIESSRRRPPISNDTTEYLLSSENNAEQLLASIHSFEEQATEEPQQTEEVTSVETEEKQESVEELEPAWISNVRNARRSATIPESNIVLMDDTIPS